MSIKTKVAMTYEEVSPGVPFWGPNAVTTELISGQTEISIENLLSGRTYYIKTWNEDGFGNKSREITRVVKTPEPTRELPLVFSANGVLDEGSPCYAFIKVPLSVKAVTEAKATVAFRQFMAPAQSASSSGTLTSDSGGGSTSGSSSASSSNSSVIVMEKTDAYHSHTDPQGGTTGSALNTLVMTNLTNDGAHTHGITHTHSTPNHTHSVAGHTHSLVYGTFEETYPASHDAFLNVYKREGGSWVIQRTYDHLTDDLEDIDISAVITGPGDYRLAIASHTGQPNSGRLGCDIYGALSCTV